VATESLPDEGFGGAILAIGSLTLDDVVIAGSSAVRGGAIAVAGGSLRLEGATVLRGNTASDQGGAIYLDTKEGGSSLTVLGTSVLHSNRAEYGGAIAAQLGTILVAGAAQIRDNVAGTAIDTPNGGGGAINLIGAQLTVRGTAQIRRNKGEYGGAIQGYRLAEEDTLSRIVIKGSATITGNRSTRYGAAISASGPILLAERAVISGNTNTSAFGGAVETWGYVGEPASLTMKGDARIKGNTGGTGGGGVIRWTGCGLVPTLSGLKGRVVNNTPKNIVQYADASEC
jgi:predicted outer membrane repeat protein